MFRLPPIIALSAISFSAGLSAQDTSNPAENDIVVIARKMRNVRLEFSTFGSHLRRCDVAVSSGEARTDRLVCAMLKACVREGHREVETAQKCLANKINTIEAYQRPDQDSNSSAPPVPPISADQTVPDAPQIDRNDAESTDETAEIVVTAPKLPAAGSWRFSAISVSMDASPIRGTSPKNWQQCIKSDATGTTLQKMIGKNVSYSDAGVCKMLKLTVSNGKIASQRRCLTQSGRSMTRIDGSYSVDQIRYEERTETAMLKRPEGGEGANRETISIVTGSRVGNCANR
jgi:hypothetical protein